MIDLFKKYKEVILYLIFGGLTTLVNIGVYYLCDTILHWGTIASTIIAWFLSVIFAFITNKIFVFESKEISAKKLFFETVSFFACRGFSGLLDLAIMWTTVDLLHWNGLLMKIISNIFVIIINYVFSKWIIFRKKTTH